MGQLNYCDICGERLSSSDYYMITIDPPSSCLNNVNARKLHVECHKTCALDVIRYIRDLQEDRLKKTLPDIYQEKINNDPSYGGEKK